MDANTQLPKQGHEAVNQRKWPYVVFVIVFLWLTGIVLSFFVPEFSGVEADSLTGNVALIPLKGVIMGDSTDGFFDDSTSSQDIIKLIERADEDSRIRAIIIEINSPGGSPVASDEIAMAIKKTNKTTVAWIREVGASGGYWVASATDHIVANRMSITGSIGVVASYLDFSGFIGRYNVSYERMVAGKYKDLGTPYRELTTEERAIFQNVLDDLHDEFIDEVAANRNMPRKDVEKAATGLFYLGSEAKRLGLVDELGSKDEVISYIERTEGIKADIVTYKTTGDFWSLFGAAIGEQSFHIGQGIGDALTKSEPSGFTLTA